MHMNTNTTLVNNEAWFIKDSDGHIIDLVRNSKTVAMRVLTHKQQLTPTPLHVEKAH